ncbi:MAG: T9SS type A sorting domain-containing protein [Bacteroidales bacterium]|nr:T9SS type A sorting domain-containing protein [Bacteroidales bacterium]MBN2698764.1 T9SS type A sorting domain-containing protein [Bacteroidales bacterium]
MKKTTLFSILAFAFSLGLFAQEPKQVEFEIVANPLTEGSLPMTAGGQEIWGDYNNDGLIDMLIAAGQGTPFTGLYKNNGDGTFTEQLTDVTMYALATAVFFDYNNDGNLDLIVGGSVDGTNEAVLTELYENSGEPEYNLVLKEEVTFVGISTEAGGDNSSRMIETVDYDNDGWIDVFISGNAGAEWEVSGTSRVVALYKNNAGTFELQTTPVGGASNFVSMNGGGIHCGDVNNDGYTDMVVSGYVDGDIQSVTDLYLNDGNGGFTYFADSRTLFTGHVQGETFFADVNNDGNLDIVEVGRDVNNGWSHFANIFLNNGEATFQKIEAAENGLIGGQASVASGDINNDGLIDMVFSGWGPNTTLFYNDGDNTFTAVAISPDQARARGGCVTFTDFTKDNSLDFTIFGYRDGGDGTPENPTWPNYILENKLADGISANEAPSAPANFMATQEGENVILTWDLASDDTTPSDALRYNVFAAAKEGSSIFQFFPADTATGLLKASGERPLISGTTITLRGFNADSYIFGVQAVDNAKVGSEFSTLDITGIEDRYNQLNGVTVHSYKDIIYLKNDLNNSISYKVISVNGQIVSHGTCEAYGSLQLRTTDKGVFMVQVSGVDGTSTRKVLLY